MGNNKDTQYGMFATLRGRITHTKDPLLSERVFYYLSTDVL